MNRARSPVRPARDLALAVSTLTALPVKVDWPKGERTDAPGYYPFVGLVLGATAYCAVLLLRLAGWDGRAPLVVAALVVAYLAAATRMLHWDGLGDVADGYWAHDTSRRLEIMSDSAVGAFAVTAIALGVTVEVAAVGSVIAEDRLIGLLLAPAFARLAATFGAWLGAPAKTTGMGASVVARPRVGALLPAGAVLIAVTALAVWTLGIVSGMSFSVAALVLSLGVPHVISRRFGGVTGDVLGASVVVVEAALFALLAVWR